MSSVSKFQDVRYLLICFDSFWKELWTNTRLSRIYYMYNFRMWNQWHTKTTIYDHFQSTTCSTKHKIPSNKFCYKYVIFAALKIAPNFLIRYNWFLFLIHIGCSRFECMYGCHPWSIALKSSEARTELIWKYQIARHTIRLALFPNWRNQI